MLLTSIKEECCIKGNECLILVRSCSKETIEMHYEFINFTGANGHVSFYLQG